MERLKEYWQKVIIFFQDSAKKIKNMVDSLSRQQKKMAAGIGGGVVLVILLAFIISPIVRPIIRAEQIDSIGQREFGSPKVSQIFREEIDKKITGDGVFIAFIDEKDNPLAEPLLEMFDDTDKLAALSAEIFVYQPIYDVKELAKRFNLQDPNTLVYFSEGAEQERLILTKEDLNGNQLVEKMNLIVNPKIAPKQKIRVETPDESAESGEEATADTTEE
ncbi:hypothetical protein [Vagococcus acidifermentans]|uniref:Uncharacterized protein n=1 Tax=Vagococcus acidifermentans TaxID=564710 RepID=A0A430ARH1_9ENTE|nr:hypothetical protein [Vagococcus acidifermentans]RSU10654.1 hypothetical protein CBF27_10070 [Vagococcus acidifermentans]